VIFKEYGIYDQNSINQLFNVLRSVLSVEKTCPAGSRERLLRWNSKPGDSISGVLTKMIKSMAGRVPPALLHISAPFLMHKGLTRDRQIVAMQVYTCIARLRDMKHV